MPMPEPDPTTPPMQTYRLRLPKEDVDGLRALALNESVRRGRQIGWCELLRSALKHMAQDRTVIE